MGIVREYTGDFTPELAYFDDLSRTIDDEIKAISDIVNSIQGDNTWNSIGADESIISINNELKTMSRVKDTIIDEANKMFDGIDGLLAKYEK